MPKLCAAGGAVTAVMFALAFAGASQAGDMPPVPQPPSPAPPTCAVAVIDDWVADGKIDGQHTIRCLRMARLAAGCDDLLDIGRFTTAVRNALRAADKVGADVAVVSVQAFPSGLKLRRAHRGETRDERVNTITNVESGLRFEVVVRNRGKTDIKNLQVTMDFLLRFGAERAQVRKTRTIKGLPRGAWRAVKFWGFDKELKADTKSSLRVAAHRVPREVATLNNVRFYPYFVAPAG